MIGFLVIFLSLVIFFIGMSDNENKINNKKILTVFVIAFILLIIAFVTPLGNFLFNEDLRYLRNAEDYLNTFYPVNRSNLQGAKVMLSANNLDYGSRISLRLNNLNSVFIMISNDLESGLEYKVILDEFGDFPYSGRNDDFLMMMAYIENSNSLMENAIEILEDI